MTDSNNNMNTTDNKAVDAVVQEVLNRNAEDIEDEIRIISQSDEEELMQAQGYMDEKGIPLTKRAKLNSWIVLFSIFLVVIVIIYLMSISKSSIYFILSVLILISLCCLIYVLWNVIVRLKKTQVELARFVNREKKSRMEQAGLLDHVSHNIRTPINAIVGLINMAKDQTKDEAVQKILDKLSGSTDYLFSILQDVLNISHIESGKTKLDLKPVLLADIADDALSMIRVGLAEKGLSINILRQDRDGITVLADAPRIQEVLVNILGNAIKFSKEGGSISFSAQTKPIRDTNKINVIYTISDNGVGMTEDVVKTIFDEFAESKNSTNGLGTEIGLGMPITKKIVTLMNGTIHVDSKVGVGSTFVVEIPLEKTEGLTQEPAQQSVKKMASLKGLHALLAEDNTMNAEIAAYMLENKDIEVTVVSNGREAVETFAKNPEGTFDVILMDVMMPELDGYQATKKIRMMDRSDAKTIPIIAMTANAFAEDVKKALDSGMNAHISKPVREDHLARVIAKEVGASKEAQKASGAAAPAPEAAAPAPEAAAPAPEAAAPAPETAAPVNTPVQPENAAAATAAADSTK